MSLSHDDAFLADICEHPRDDAPRLIFADWLDDHGDAGRAEFIRTQCALAKLPATDQDHRGLLQREGELLRAHEAAWRAGLPVLPGIKWESFTRGFVEAVSAETVAAFVQHADAIFAAAPVLRLQICDIDGPSAIRLSRTPHLARLAELNVGNNPALRDFGALALVRSPHLANLNALLLHYTGLGDAAVAAVSEASQLGRLTELYLSGNGLTDDAVVALARSPHLPRLVDLDLRDNQIGDVGARALAYARERGNLATLWLVHNQISHEGAWALAGTEALPGLTRLYINYNPIGNDGAVAFASSPHRHALRDLDLSGCGIRDAGGTALAQSAYLEWLELLWLRGNHLRVETLAQLRRRFGERLRV